MSDFDKKRREKAMRRRHPDPSTTERLHEELGKLDDWRVTCQACNVVRTGTLAQASGPCPSCGASR